MKKALLSFLLMTGVVMAVSPDSHAQETLQNAPLMGMSFETPAEMDRWRAVNDGVMGGRSSGGPVAGDGHMVFAGVINTNGGGFSSIRRSLDGRQIKNARAVTMRVKSDGRTYGLRFRTNVTYWGRRIAFGKPVPVTKAGEWETVTIPLENMRASLYGRGVQGAEFVAADVVETGIILADGQDGPFRLEIDWIRVE